MAFITCPNCGQQASRKAAACPHCGQTFRVLKYISKLSLQRSSYAGEKGVRRMKSRFAPLLGLVCFLVACATGNHLPIPPGMEKIKEHRFHAYPNQLWQKQGIEINRGDFVRVTASGRWGETFVTFGPEGSRLLGILAWTIPPFQILSMFLPKPLSPPHCVLVEFEKGGRIAIGREYSVDNSDGTYSGPLYFRDNVVFGHKPLGALDVCVEIYRKQLRASRSIE